MMHRKYIWLLLCFSLVACQKSDKQIDAYAFQTETNGGWGLMSKDGTILVASNTFERQPSSVVNGMFTLPDGTGRFQLYNLKSPKVAVSPRHFVRIGYFFEEVTVAQETANAPFIIIDKQGNTIAPINYPGYTIILAHNFYNGRALVMTQEGKFGYANTEGELSIPPLYDCAYDFHEGKAIVGITDKEGNTNYSIINTKGKTLLSVQQNNVMLDKQVSDGLLMYKDMNSGQCGYMTVKGKIVNCLPTNVCDSYHLEYGMTLFSTPKGTGIMKADGTVVIPAEYEDAIVADKEHIALEMHGKWALVDIKGMMLTDYAYDTIGKFNDKGLALVQKQGRWQWMDSEGKLKGKPCALIYNDPIAAKEHSDVFVRTTVIAVNSRAAQENQPALPTERANAVQAGTVQQSAANHADTHTNHSVDWKQISRESPFYAEAAKIVSGKLTETDAEHRRVILNYVEHLRTSYTTKDIDFLNQLFSEQALIVVGNVVRSLPQKEKGYLAPAQVTYNVHTKREYLEKLKLVFKANKKIDLKFSDFHIMRHPTTPGLYGVSLRQRYTSDRYSDDGYLFLLWDFRNEAAPKIHVRTWQPYWMDNHTPIPEESVFNIRDFNLQ